MKRGYVIILVPEESVFFGNSGLLSGLDKYLFGTLDLPLVSHRVHETYKRKREIKAKPRFLA